MKTANESSCKPGCSPAGSIQRGDDADRWPSKSSQTRVVRKEEQEEEDDDEEEAGPRWRVTSLTG